MLQPKGMCSRALVALTLALVIGCAPADGNEVADALPVVADAMTLPPANPADVESVEAIVHAVYDVISGGPGEERNWDRWRSLFLPNARLMPVGSNGSGGWITRGMSAEEFVANTNDSFMENGFYEIEIGSVTEQYGSIAHRFSSYASFRTEEDEEPFNRGINSFQLLNDGERWWVLTVFWQAEGDAGPIPDRYLDSP